VIGIVSSRITEKYSRPSILVSFEGNTEGESADNVGKGSGRSIKGLNLVDALCYCSRHLVKFGGHELAAGLSVTRSELPAFIKKINEFARANLSEKDMVPVMEADCEIAFSDISMGLAEELQRLEPFGVGNPVPLFIMRNVNVMELSGVSDSKHTRLVLSDGSSTASAMFFSNSPTSLGVSVGDKVDLLFSIDINEWQDRKSVQLIVRDLKVSVTQESVFAREEKRFEEIHNGEPFLSSEEVLPDRDDFIAVYRFIQSSIHNGVNTFAHRDLVAKLSQGMDSRKIGYIKLKFIMLIFTEMNLIGIEEIKKEVYRFTLRYSSSKKNLEKSSILKKLRLQQR